MNTATDRITRCQGCDQPKDWVVEWPLIVEVAVICPDPENLPSGEMVPLSELTLPSEAVIPNPLALVACAAPPAVEALRAKPLLVLPKLVDMLVDVPAAEAASGKANAPTNVLKRAVFMNFLISMS